MDIRLNQLKEDFTNISKLKDENIVTLGILSHKINKLKELYAEFIKNNRQNMFIFGLDSFHFQGKLIDIEYDDMNRLFLAITNRMYCEYFKLYKIIIEYISKNITDQKLLDLIKINNNYPIYKDLEPFKVYDFKLIQNIHEIIITLLYSINGCVVNKELELNMYKIKNNSGLNIDNFVNTFNFNIIMMREKLTLFVTYIEFFHKLHNKYFKRFTTKVQLMFGQINHDITFEDTDQTKKIKRNSLLTTIKDEHVDMKILEEIKNSINSADNSSVSSNEKDSPKNLKNDNNKPSIMLSMFPGITNENDKMKSVDSNDTIESENIIIIHEEMVKEEVTEPIVNIIEEPEIVLKNKSVNEKIVEVDQIEEEVQQKEEEPIQKETPVEEKKEENKDIIEIKENSVDDLSVLTMDSSSNNGSVDPELSTPEPKKKRTYKPRQPKK
jgi:hypothetical protein